MKGQPKINEISDPLILERFVAIADYEKQKKNECSVSAGQTVEVIDKNENGVYACMCLCVCSVHSNVFLCLCGTINKG